MSSRVGSQFKSPKDSPGFMLWRVSNEWQSTIRTALKDVDLTHAQFVLLASTIWLEDHGKTVNQAALSRQAAMDKMMVSDVVKGLEKKKFIRRTKSLTDARSLTIAPTQKGVDVLKSGMKAVEKSNRIFFSRSHFNQTEIVEMLRSLSSMEISD